MELETYQLQDTDKNPMGLIQTDAPEGEVESIWRRVYRDEVEPEELLTLIRENADSDGEAEQLSVLLEEKGYIVNRIWVTEIMP